MYIRRKVFSTYIDEETGEEKMFSVNEIVSEEAYLEQHQFSEEKKEKKLRAGDKIGIWSQKHLNTKKGREAVIEAYDQEGPRNSHKLGKESAKWSGAAGAATGAIVGGVLGHRMGGKKGAALGALAGGAGYGAATAGAGYVGTRVGHKIRKGIENVSTGAAENSQRIADRAKVASGKTTREEYAQKHGRTVKKKED